MEKHTPSTFPWYKERLQTKYPKDPTNKTSSVSSCWRFVNMSLDDFSDCSSVLCGFQRGVSPVIFQGRPKPKASQKPRKCISKQHACFSKQMTQKQIRGEYVTAVEEKLKRHPLVIYPHYKDHMTPELYDKVVSILDPDMCVNSASALPRGDCVEEGKEENCPEPSKKEVHKAKQGTAANKICPDVQNPSPRNPYTLKINRNVTKKHQIVSGNQLCAHKDKKKAAKLFSKWFASPHEEIKVSECTTKRRFDSGLQDPSDQTFPIQVDDADIVLSAKNKEDNNVLKASDPNKAQKE